MLKKIFLTVFIVILFYLPVWSKVIFLKNGKILHGKILPKTGISIRVKLKNGKIKAINQNSVLRILPNNIYLGKLWVKKLDGTTIPCYLVDESQKYYTFRKKLFEPKEFTLDRNEIRSILRSNPSGLQGKVGIDRVDLTWFSPPIPVNEYRIYIRQRNRGNEKFKNIDSTDDEELIIDDLKSNTKYEIYVTAIDKEGDESLPGNILKIKTKNMPPSAPDLNKVKVLSGGQFLISWEKSSDKDGRVVKYAIFRKVRGKIRRIKTTNSTEYVLPRKLKYDNIYVAAIDNMNMQSQKSRVWFPGEKAMYAGVGLTYIFPLGKFSDFTSPGYGAVFHFGISNFLLKPSELSFESGFIIMGKKKELGVEGNKIHKTLFIPFVVSMGYSFHLKSGFSISPCLSFGGAFFYEKYEYLDNSLGINKDIEDTFLDPLFGVGCNVKFNINENIFYYFDGDFRVALESSDLFPYISASLGIGINL